MVTNEDRTVTVRILGFLRRYMDERGLPYVLEEVVPDAGITAHELAQKLSIPPEKVEGVFKNGQVINIYDSVGPGDRVALLPHGTPGPYRFFLGMDRENRERAKKEACSDSP